MKMKDFSEALKKAIQSNMKGKITVTLKYSYFDAVQHQWLPYLENGQQKYATQIIDPTGDGSYDLITFQLF